MADGQSVGAFESADGAQVEFLTTGAGPAVIAIPGALSTAEDYADFAAALGRDFTVLTLQRRGRGGSAPQGEGYGIAMECADVLALQQLSGAACVFGHSYGGLIALEAACRSPLTIKVAVYEPGVSVNGSISLGWMADVERLLASGRPLDAFARFSVAAGPREARRMPVWLMKAMIPHVVGAERLRRMLALLPTTLKEHRVIGDLGEGHTRYGEISAQVLVMTGGRSRLDYAPVAVEALRHVIPAISVRAFPQLDHFGPDRSGPDAVAAAVSAFFQSESREAAQPSE